VVCPQCSGATNWMAPSYSPLTKLFYVNVREGCDVFFSKPPVYKEGTSYWATGAHAKPREHQTGRVTALNPLTGRSEMEVSAVFVAVAGTLVTSGTCCLPAMKMVT